MWGDRKTKEGKRVRGKEDERMRRMLSRPMNDQ
jgi:hypothetical protein